MWRGPLIDERHCDGRRARARGLTESAHSSEESGERLIVRGLTAPRRSGASSTRHVSARSMSCHPAEVSRCAERGLPGAGTCRGLPLGLPRTPAGGEDVPRPAAAAAAAATRRPDSGTPIGGIVEKGNVERSLSWRGTVALREADSRVGGSPRRLRTQDAPRTCEDAKRATKDAGSDRVTPCGAHELNMQCRHATQACNARAVNGRSPSAQTDCAAAACAAAAAAALPWRVPVTRGRARYPRAQAGGPNGRPTVLPPRSGEPMTPPASRFQRSRTKHRIVERRTTRAGLIERTAYVRAFHRRVPAQAAELKSILQHTLDVPPSRSI
jgi:hypothetical protein